MPEKKRDNAKLRIIFSSMLFAIVCIAEFYAMIVLPQQYIVVGLLGILFLLCLYILVSGIMGEAAKRQEKQEEQYANILISQKASYLMTKKCFEEIRDKLILIEKGTKVPTEELIGTQKGIGKVVINRSRENAEAIINSNDQVLESIKHLENLLENTDMQTSDADEIGEASIRQLLENQQELLAGLKDIEQRLNHTFTQIQQEAQAPIAAAVSEEPVPAEEQKADETVKETVPEVKAEPEPMPKAEEKPPEPDTSDPNKVMSPDDIAALLASMADEKPAEETVPEAKTEPEPVPKEEEKPPMPDTSDPNKIMSPDDIAALFAAMG